MSAEHEGSDSDFSDKESDDEPMKEDKPEAEDVSDVDGLVFDPENVSGIVISLMFSTWTDLAGIINVV